MVIFQPLHPSVNWINSISPPQHTHTLSPNTALINKSWLQLTDSLLNGDHKKWICDESWYRIMCSQLSNLVGAFTLKLSSFVWSILLVVGAFDQLNANGVYRKAFKSMHPYDGLRPTVNYSIRHKIGAPQSIHGILPVGHIMNNNSLKCIAKKKGRNDIGQVSTYV